MEIINTSIRIINYETEEIITRETPTAFNEYIEELISHINSNKSTRQFKTKTVTTEAISEILKLLEDRDNQDIVNECYDVIAKRLLRSEIDAQSRVSQMNTNVKKGSLIQALLFNEDAKNYEYMLAKVEHSDFVDDLDFTFKTGFSKDRKTIWKSCLFNLINPGGEVFQAKIYSDTKAKYWSSDFLELDEIITDEKNTLTTFAAIDETLKRNIRRNAPQDYLYLRNAFITYLRGNEHIDYQEMINNVINKYPVIELSPDKFEVLKGKFLDLPERKKFDRQFTSIPEAITTKIKITYKISDGIELRINKEIENILKTIKAISDPETGDRYLRIKLENDDTYQYFKE